MRAARPQNVPVGGGATLTLTGLNFARDASAAIGASACEATTWVSATAVLCTSPRGAGLAVSVHVSEQADDDARRRRGTMARLVTYDAPVVTFVVVPVGPDEAGLMRITLHGVNLGASDRSPKAAVLPNPGAM